MLHIFVIYASGVHEAVEQGPGEVSSIYFVDGVTWIASRQSVSEVQAKFEAAARGATGWGVTALGSGVEKAEAILFSRSRRRWRERAHFGVGIGPTAHRSTEELLYG